MYCLICTKTKQKTILFFPGTTRMKKSVLVEHAKTQAHKQAIIAQKQRDITAVQLKKELESNDRVAFILLRQSFPIVFFSRFLLTNRLMYL